MSRRPRRLVAVSSALSLVWSVLALVAFATVTAVAGGTALAAPASAAPTTGPVSADALPTVQINGVVWRQAIAGNVAFAGGEFTNARPAGSAPGVNTVPRTNLLAYDIRTGNLIASFNPVLNGKVNDMTVTPDGTKLVVGGQFTTVNGLNRYRVAVFNLTGTDTSTPTISLSTFAPTVDGSVYAVAATNSTVFVGGQFAVAGKQPRARFASFALSNGALNPAVINVDDQSVKSMVVSTDGSKIVLSGNFTSVNSSNNPGFGLYMANASTGAGLPFPVNSEVRDGGANAAILHVATDGTYIYGGGYKFNAGASGNSEGTFQAKWSDGSLVTLEDCHGDTYDIAPVGDLVYKASHKHYCGNSGGFPQTDPWTRWDATAWTKTAEGAPNIKDAYGYLDHPGTLHPGLAAFFPQTDVGTYTGKGQSVWTVTGNSDYVIYGGEFPKVNGVDQQGLVRYAIRSNATNKQAPRTTDTLPFTVTAKSLEPGKVRVTWPTLWDKDDTTLSYDIYRDGSLIKSLSATAFQWDGYQMNYDDTGLQPGSMPTYQVRVSDPTGNKNSSSTTTVTVAGTDSVGTYGSKVLADGASKYWRLDDSGNAVNDLGGSDNTTTGTGVSRGAGGALLNSGDTASTFNGTTNGRISSSQLVNTTSNMSEEVWFKTTSTSGKLTGFGNVQTGQSSLYDRHIYMSSNKVCFGVTTNVNQSICTPNNYNDGKWHQAVATLGSNGMVLYLDGGKSVSNTSVTYGRPYPSYFRLGGDNTWSGNQNFTGQLDEVSLYPSQLNAQQVDDHWVASGRTSTNPTPNTNPTASFSNTASNLVASFNGSASSDPDGTISSYAWTFGDGGTGTGVSPQHTYAASGSYPVTLKVTDNRGGTGSVTQQVTVTPVNQAPTASFTSSASNLVASFNGSGSSDPDGSITGYAWNFGDGATGSGVSPQHTYTAAGTYTVGLTVTDNNNATGFTSKSVTVTAAPNTPPTAAFTSTQNNLNLAVDGTTSKDPDGSIISYTWNWGETGAADSTGSTQTHGYAAAGTYMVTLTVKDDKNATASTQQSVTVTAPAANQPPVASFTSSSTGQTASFDAGASSDPDGSIASYAWDYGDGQNPGFTGTGVTSSHHYAAPGTYSVILKVTDNKGDSTLSTQQVVVDNDPPPANKPPTASFTANTTNRAVAVDASTSDDPDGSIVSYSWNWGDGSPADTGVTQNHTYAADGDYTITLTVTDDDTASTVATKSVTASTPTTATTLAKDDFNRTSPAAGGWGNATIGGAWTMSAAKTQYTVIPGIGKITIPTNGRPLVDLKSLSLPTSDTTIEFSVDKIVPTTYVGINGRQVGADTYNSRIKVAADGTTQLYLLQDSAQVGSALTLPFPIAADTHYKFRFQVKGATPTTLSAKVWKASDAEPGAWQLTSMNTFGALQAPGYVGLYSYIPSGGPLTTSFYNFLVTDGK